MNFRESLSSDNLLHCSFCEISSRLKRSFSCLSLLSISTESEVGGEHNDELQSWTKVLGTVLQYSYFFVISRFPLKTVHHFRNFLAVLSPSTLYKVETRKKFWIHASNIVCGVNWKTAQKRKSVPRLLSMILDTRNRSSSSSFFKFSISVLKWLT